MSSIVERPATFRLGAPADVARIVALVESAYRGDVSRKGWTTEADLLDGQRTDPAGVAELVARPGSIMLVAERDGMLIACANLEKRGHAGYFGMFCVRRSTWPPSAPVTFPSARATTPFTMT